ncbi:MAG: aconitase X catalytic domain-containing protein, partial [Gemmatimonadetes bacterium]|nr:aconitase X catalytic domain-containing protein [Gemmatimonadota bacterium]
RLADGGARVRVPTTLNVSGVDPHGWRDWAVPESWAEPARRQMDAYERMGCAPTWTCAPYQTETRPGLGEQVAWGESSAIVFANSVLGARTERYPDLLDICCAVTGRAPAAGLHLDENRVGEILFDVSAVPDALARDPALYPVLGHLVGLESGSRVPVLDGIDVTPSEDDFKALGAAMASSGAVALFHWVGVTPEAPDRATAFAGDAPQRARRVSMDDLRSARAVLAAGLATGDALDLVVLGSPHFSLTEFARLAPLLEGRTAHDDVRVLITMSRAVRALAETAGHLETVRRFGAELTVDTCILTSPMLPDDVRGLMTNSAKYAYYTPGLLDRAVAFGSLEDCVESAVAGRVVIDDGAWS